MILGVRNVGKNMPLKSRLGNTITRKVFKLLSGVSILDTQTGIRVFTQEGCQGGEYGRSRGRLT